MCKISMEMSQTLLKDIKDIQIMEVYVIFTDRERHYHKIQILYKLIYSFIASLIFKNP